MLADKVWYQDGATVVAAVALGVSLVSSLISMWHTEVKDKQDAHLDLRTVLQRLLALPKESIDLRDKYKGSSDLDTINLALNLEMTFLASQGALLARKLGEKLVTVPEYLTLARAQCDVFNYTAQSEFIEHALNLANTANDLIAALRDAATFQFARGNYDAGRAKLSQALATFETYKGYDPGTVAVTKAQIRYNWAQLEGAIGNFEGAQQQLTEAMDMLAQAPVTPYGDMLKQQIQVFWNAPPTTAAAVTNPVQVAGAPIAARASVPVAAP